MSASAPIPVGTHTAEEYILFFQIADENFERVNGGSIFNYSRYYAELLSLKPEVLASEHLMTLLHRIVGDGNGYSAGMSNLVALMFYEEIERMPLFISHNSFIERSVAQWRLWIGK